MCSFHYIQVLIRFGKKHHWKSVFQSLYKSTVCWVRWFAPETIDVRPLGEVQFWFKTENHFEELDLLILIILFLAIKGGGGGGSVGRARDSLWGGPWFDPRCDRPLPAGWVGVSKMWPTETKVMVFPLCLVCGSTMSDVSLGTLRDIALLLTTTLRNQTNLP